MNMATLDYQTSAGVGHRTVRMPRARAAAVEAFEDGWQVSSTFKTILQNVDTVDGASSEEIDLGPLAAANVELFVLSGSSFVGRGSIGSAQVVLSRRDRDLSRELNTLGTIFVEDYGRALDTSSVAGLRLFLIAHSWTTIPSLSADSTGRIVATWRAGAQSASLKFLDNNVFHYALAVETEQAKSRPWGTAGRFEFFVERPEARAILGASAPASVAPA